MASYTENLNLFKKNPLVELDDAFNIRTMLNENWDKLDKAFGDISSPFSSLGLTGDVSVAKVLNVLANVGNVHVWERVQDGVTDYLTSTDRNAYPDQSAEGGSEEVPAHYTLADAETVDVLSSGANYTAYVYSCALDSIIVNNDGSIDTSNFSMETGGSTVLTSAGNWKSFSPTKAYYITSGSENVVFTDTLFTVSEETTLNYVDSKYVLPGCMKLIGHAKVEAIPAGTSITYLGQLGRSNAKIGVGSYVGTGTYGPDNPISLAFEFPPKFVFIRGVKSARSAALLIHGVEGSYIDWGFTTGSSYREIVCTWNEKNLSFYANGNGCYCNVKSEEYLYVYIG